MRRTLQHALRIYFPAFAALALAISIVRYSQDAFEASVHGLTLWWTVVLPALLPFFALADILRGLGVVHFIGVFLEPIMRPLFRIPGPGAFALAVGLASGYPIGARITGQLCREKLCTSVEGERLISLANTADPLFLGGAVAVGMFSRPELAAVLATAHYSAVFIVGLLMRFHGRSDRSSTSSAKHGGSTTPLTTRAFAALSEARIQDGRPFGKLLNDAVRETFMAMLFVGGCIVLFSVLFRMLVVSGLLDSLTAICRPLLTAIGLDPDLDQALVSGLWEITIGTTTASEVTAPLHEQVMAASAVIGWSGLSVHTQVAAMTQGTGIRMWPYMAARGLHGAAAAAITFLLLGPFSTAFAPAFSWLMHTPLTLYWSARLAFSTGLALLFIMLLLLALLVLLWIQRTGIILIRR